MLHVMLFRMLNVLYFYMSTFRSMCAVPNMSVLCNSLTSCSPVMLLRYFLEDFGLFPVVPISSGVTVVLVSYIRCISVVKTFIFQDFLSFFLDHISVS